MLPENVTNKDKILYTLKSLNKKNNGFMSTETARTCIFQLIYVPSCSEVTKTVFAPH